MHDLAKALETKDPEMLKRVKFARELFNVVLTKQSQTERTIKLEKENFDSVQRRPMRTKSQQKVGPPMELFSPGMQPVK